MNKRDIEWSAALMLMHVGRWTADEIRDNPDQWRRIVRRMRRVGVTLSAILQREEK